MGTINHNAIIATTWSSNIADEFAKWLASNLPAHRFIRTEIMINNFQSFVLPPDGSKEGFEDSNTGDVLRQKTIERLQQDCYEDGSSPWKWVEVSFGEFGQRISNGNNQNEFDDREYFEK
jgi:hypothetical protein